MRTPDTLTLIEANLSSYGYMHENLHDLKVQLKRGPIQIDEDADIYYGFDFKTEEEE